MGIEMGNLTDDLSNEALVHLGLSPEQMDHIYAYEFEYGFCADVRRMVRDLWMEQIMDVSVDEDERNTYFEF